MSYIKGACGMSVWYVESNESMYRNLDIDGITVEWLNFVKSVYKSRIEGGGVKGRPPFKLISRVDEY